MTNQLRRPRLKEYMVMTQRDSFFHGSFNPEKLDEAINHYAAQGWVVTAMTTAQIAGGLVGNRDELIVLFERGYVEPPPAPPVRRAWR